MLQIVRLQPAIAYAASRLFEVLQADASTFHPHPMNLHEACRLAQDDGRDVYSLALVRERGALEQAVAYGMLRGWDEGFAIPMLGIAVHPDFRGRGVGRAMMEYLHCIARLRRAPAVKLKVYADNEPAIALYESLGYTFMPEPQNGQRVGVLKFREEL